LNLTEFILTFPEEVVPPLKRSFPIHLIIQGILDLGFILLLCFCAVVWGKLIPAMSQTRYITTLCKTLESLRFPQRIWITMFICTNFIRGIVNLVGNVSNNDQAVVLFVLTFSKVLPIFVLIMASLECGIMLLCVIPKYITNDNFLLNRVNRTDTLMTFAFLIIAALFAVINSVISVLVQGTYSAWFMWYSQLVEQFSLYILLASSIVVAIKLRTNPFKDTSDTDNDRKSLMINEENFGALIVVLNMIQMFFLVAHIVLSILFIILPDFGETGSKVQTILFIIDELFRSIWWLFIVLALTKMRKIFF
jgi:hypothetical protein